MRLSRRNFFMRPPTPGLRKRDIDEQLGALGDNGRDEVRLVWRQLALADRHQQIIKRVGTVRGRSQWPQREADGCTSARRDRSVDQQPRGIDVSVFSGRFKKRL